MTTDEPFPPSTTRKRSCCSALEEEVASILTDLVATSTTTPTTNAATATAAPQDIAGTLTFKRLRSEPEEVQEEDCKLPATLPLSSASSSSSSSRQILHNDSKQQQQVVTVNEDVLGLVMEYLAPRELLRLSVCNKTLRAKITIPLVVRSAMMHGGRSARTIHALYPLHRHMSIFPVSPLRLLRLVNGKWCEACRLQRVNHVRSGFGVFLCNHCLTATYTRVLPIKRWDRFEDNKYTWAVDHPRIVTQQQQHLHGKKYCMWSGEAAWYDHKNQQEPCGPLISFADVEQMEAPDSSNMDAFRDTHLESILGRTLPLPEEYHKFLEAYKECKEAAETAQNERVEKRRLVLQATAAKRTTKALQVLENVKALLDPRWRECALEYTPTGFQGKNPCIRFVSPVAEEALQLFATFPSKANKTTISNIARDLNNKFRLLQERVIDSSWGILETSNPFMDRFRDYVQMHVADLKAYILHPKCGNLFFDYLQEKDYLAAMLLLIPADQLDDLVLLNEHDDDDVIPLQIPSSSMAAATATSSMATENVSSVSNSNTFPTVASSLPEPVTSSTNSSSSPIPHDSSTTPPSLRINIMGLFSSDDDSTSSFESDLKALNDSSDDDSSSGESHVDAVT